MSIKKFHNIGPRFIDCIHNHFQVLKASHYGAETTTFTCSVFESCQSYLANNTFDGMIVSTCCNTDYCNDHLGRYLFIAIYVGLFSEYDRMSEYKKNHAPLFVDFPGQ